METRNGSLSVARSTRLFGPFAVALGVSLVTGCGQSKFSSSPTNVAPAAPVAPRVEGKSAESGAATPTRPDGYGTADEPASPDGELASPVPTRAPGTTTAAPLECPTALLAQYARQALRGGETLKFPSRDPRSGAPLVVTAQGALPPGVTLSGAELRVGTERRAAAATARLGIAVPAVSGCAAVGEVAILPDDVLISTTSLSLGARGELFMLKGNWPRKTLPGGTSMPDFDAMTKDPRSDIFIPRFDLTCSTSEQRACKGESGFVIDGYADLKSYFGYRFTTRLVVDAPGEYQFSSYSDDGVWARLTQGPGLVQPLSLVEDGNDHVPQTAFGPKVVLAKGVYSMVVDWYQGPIGEFALELRWKRPGAAAFEPIPSDALPLGK